MERLGGRRVLVVGTSSAGPAADSVVAALVDRVARRFDGPVVHIPVAVTDELVADVGSDAADMALAIGGGSTRAGESRLCLHRRAFLETARG